MAEEGPEKSEIPPTQISPEILDSLGLTAEDVQNYDREQLELDRYRENSRKRGMKYYDAKRENSYLESFYIDDFALPHNTSMEEFPDATMSRFEDTKTTFNPDTQNKYLVGIKGFLEGYGSQAIEESDGVSAVNAYDVATEGGIMQNQEVLGRLMEIAQSNKTAGVDMAKAIQERINGRKEATQQTPDPQRIPAEQGTPPEYAADDPRRADVGGQEEHPADLRPAPLQGNEPQV